MQNKPIQIAVDGFSSCGKSTLARELAQNLGFVYIDSGAMYRAVTLFALRRQIVDENSLNLDKLIDSLNEITIHFELDSDNNPITFLNNENVEEEIRTIKVSSKVSIISAIPEVRKKMVLLQREFSGQKSVVMDGRDIGTVVFPDAALKIFVTAGIEVRAQRRHLELSSKNKEADFETIKKNLTERDYLDQNRADSPLKMAQDAILVDNSNLTREQQLALVLKLVEKVIHESGN
jgi:CMP/dCMP kinase